MLEVASSTTSAAAGPNWGLPEYVARHHDELLLTRVRRAAAGVSTVVMLISDSTSGKKRALWEAIRAVDGETGNSWLAGWRVWPPVSPQDPSELVADAARIGPRTVIWLPGAERYFLSAGPDVGNQVGRVVRDLVYDVAPVLVLGTFRAQAWSTLVVEPPRHEPDLYPHPRGLLAGSHIAVPDTFTKAETQSALRSRDRRVADAARHATRGAVIQQIAAAPDLAARLANASSAARAIVQCAIDARRLGHDVWLPAELLEHGALAYMTERESARLDNSWFADAMRELTRLGPGDTSILVAPSWLTRSKRVSGGFRLEDFLERQWKNDSRQPRLPPAGLWDALVASASPPSLSALAREAGRRGLLRLQTQFYSRAVDVGVPHARRNLADVFRRAGRIDDAKVHYRELVDRGDTEALVEACRMLINADRAAEVLTWMSTRPDDDMTSLRMSAMAFDELGEKATAAQYYQRLATCGDRQSAESAASIMVDNGEVEDAVAFLMGLATQHHLEVLPIAVDILDEAYGMDAAMARLQTYAERGHHTAWLVGADLLSRGELHEDAMSWAVTATEYRVPGAEATAARIHAYAGVFDQATRHAENAASRGDATGWRAVADVLAETGATTRALLHLDDAARAGDDTAMMAAARLAAGIGRCDEAIGFWRRADESQHHEVTEAVNLAVSLCRTGHADRALEWLIVEADVSGPSVLAPLCAVWIDSATALSTADTYARVLGVSKGHALNWVGEILAQRAHEAGSRDLNTDPVSGCQGEQIPIASLVDAAAFLFLRAAIEGHLPALLSAGKLLCHFGRYHEAVPFLNGERWETWKRTGGADGFLKAEGADEFLAPALARVGRIGEAIGIMCAQVADGDTSSLVGIAAAVHAHNQAQQNAMRSLWDSARRRPLQLKTFEILTFILDESAQSLLRRAIDAGEPGAHTLYGDILATGVRPHAAIPYYLMALARGETDDTGKIEKLLTHVKGSKAVRDLRGFGLTADGSVAHAWIPTA